MTVKKRLEPVGITGQCKYSILTSSWPKVFIRLYITSKALILGFWACAKGISNGFTHFQSKKISIEQNHFSFCPRHLWLFKRRSSSRKPKSQSADAKKSKGKKKSKTKKKKKKSKDKSLLPSTATLSELLDKNDQQQEGEVVNDPYQNGFPAFEELIGDDDDSDQSNDSSDENEDDQIFDNERKFNGNNNVDHEYEQLYEKFNTRLSLNDLYEDNDRLAKFNPMKLFSSKRFNSTTSLPSQYISAEIKSKKYT